MPRPALVLLCKRDLSGSRNTEAGPAGTKMDPLKVCAKSLLLAIIAATITIHNITASPQFSGAPPQQRFTGNPFGLSAYQNLYRRLFGQRTRNPRAFDQYGIYGLYQPPPGTHGWQVVRTQKLMWTLNYDIAHIDTEKGAR